MRDHRLPDRDAFARADSDGAAGSRGWTGMSQTNFEACVSTR
jgi:hypothetical protein